MGSGREGGSPSPAMASTAAVKQVAVSSSMLTHKLQREELLEGGSYVAPNPNINTRSRTPRSGNTPLHSPRSLSPLRGLSSTEVASSEIASATLVDFQEAILRANNVRKNTVGAAQYTFHEEALGMRVKETALIREEDAPREALPSAITTNKYDEVHAQREQRARSKSPFPFSRRRSSMETTEQEDPRTTRSSKKTDADNAEWVLLGRGKSPRRTKVTSSSTSLEASEAPIERKSTRISSRRSRTEHAEDLPDADLGMGDTNRVTRKSHSRHHARQHKRKATESVTAVAAGLSSPSEQFVTQKPTVPHHHSRHHHHHQQITEFPPPPSRADHYSTLIPSPISSRRASREARMVESSDWIQFLYDTVMWRHVPRSALLFGMGCFCMMSASYVQDMQCSIFSVLAYTALFYLAVRFIKCNFSKGSMMRLSVGQFTEADALHFIRILLPPINLILQKLGDLFSGEPVVTLKVAGALWLFARLGSAMNIWTLFRIAYIASFTVPRCYTNYHQQLEAHASSMFHWIGSLWSACGHKKAVLFGGFVVLWNFSSVSTRACGGLFQNLKKYFKFCYVMCLTGTVPISLQLSCYSSPSVPIGMSYKENLILVPGSLTMKDLQRQ
ncbi:hypothetical protein KP509_35G033400 [Ceratopteris richardii]|uniref:Reticulon-like protein n=1 Tax=Ceratopteris richardii TaxID=49495 RepID=A0A8T2QEI0_CERRI|nr:hypothetical protein KP509_35G033400 [Ceratopteris richardii]